MDIYGYCLFRTNEGIYVRMKVRAKVSVTFTLTFLHGILPPRPRSVAEGANRAANECVTRGTRYGSARDVEWSRAILHPVD